ncbi:hypothetical protein B9479_007586 [Cryptococcus floricola]|uniref:Autophagy-related protein 3 n=1 Tax=Cryptococcus floricola TaxID=2591691 RepID=A0A5D3AMF6_9TREE|nr:hypothetical protein B9479_007586 [Cryptococcus floricola]
MNNPLLSIQSQYWAVRDYLSPVLKESKFKEHGRITPEEFVAAGDFLTFKFPVWQWQVEKGDGNKAREFLPADKQYLVTRNVPCLRRATAVDYTGDGDTEQLLSFLDEADEAPGPGKDDEDWVATHIGREPTHDASNMDEIPDISDSPELNASSGPTREMAGLDLTGQGKMVEDEIPDIDDIPDMDEEGAGLEDVEDDAAVKIVHPSEAEVNKTRNSNLLQVRTYDCIISYDKHYQTPRFWLFGYDEASPRRSTCPHKNPLTPAQVFQDVPADHAFKTMTMETFPNSGAQLASVHPCKHASVMKKFIDRMEAAQAQQYAPEQPEASASVGGEKDKDKKKKWGIGGMVRKVTGGSTPKVEKKDDDGEAPSGVPVDFYLVIFLKFIASIVPTIEVDSTTATGF